MRQLIAILATSVMLVATSCNLTSTIEAAPFIITQKETDAYTCADDLCYYVVSRTRADISFCDKCTAYNVGDTLTNTKKP